MKKIIIIAFCSISLPLLCADAAQLRRRITKRSITQPPPRARTAPRPCHSQSFHDTQAKARCLTCCLLAGPVKGICLTCPNICIMGCLTASCIFCAHAMGIGTDSDTL